MKLVIIYGLPAAGKSTVARELGKLTQYPVLPFHLMVDLVGSLFPLSSNQYLITSHAIRLALVKAAVQENMPGIICPYGYCKGIDDEFLKEAQEVMNNHNGNSCFVYLHCSTDALYGRVTDSKRRYWGKITSKQILRKILQEKVFPPLPDPTHLHIDNSILSSIQVAQAIKNHFKL